MYVGMHVCLVYMYVCITYVYKVCMYTCICLHMCTHVHMWRLYSAFSKRQTTLKRMHAFMYVCIACCCIYIAYVSGLRHRSSKYACMCGICVWETKTGHWFCRLFHRHLLRSEEVDVAGGWTAFASNDASAAASAQMQSLLLLLYALEHLLYILALFYRSWTDDW